MPNKNLYPPVGLPELGQPSLRSHKKNKTGTTPKRSSPPSTTSPGAEDDIPVYEAALKGVYAAATLLTNFLPPSHSTQPPVARQPSQKGGDVQGSTVHTAAMQLTNFLPPSHSTQPPAARQPSQKGDDVQGSTASIPCESPSSPAASTTVSVASLHSTGVTSDSSSEDVAIHGNVRSVSSCNAGMIEMARRGSLDGSGSSVNGPAAVASSYLGTAVEMSIDGGGFSNSSPPDNAQEMQSEEGSGSLTSSGQGSTRGEMAFSYPLDVAQEMLAKEESHSLTSSGQGSSKEEMGFSNNIPMDAANPVSDGDDILFLGSGQGSSSGEVGLSNNTPMDAANPVSDEDDILSLDSGRGFTSGEVGLSNNATMDAANDVSDGDAILSLGSGRGFTSGLMRPQPTGASPAFSNLIPIGGSESAAASAAQGPLVLDLDSLSMHTLSLFPKAGQARHHEYPQAAGVRSHTTAGVKGSSGGASLSSSNHDSAWSSEHSEVRARLVMAIAGCKAIASTHGQETNIEGHNEKEDACMHEGTAVVLQTHQANTERHNEKGGPGMLEEADAVLQTHQANTEHHSEKRSPGRDVRAAAAFDIHPKEEALSIPSCTGAASDNKLPSGGQSHSVCSSEEQSHSVCTSGGLSHSVCTSGELSHSVCTSGELSSRGNNAHPVSAAALQVVHVPATLHRGRSSSGSSNVGRSGGNGCGKIGNSDDGLEASTSRAAESSNMATGSSSGDADGGGVPFSGGLHNGKGSRSSSGDADGVGVPFSDGLDNGNGSRSSSGDADGVGVPFPDGLDNGNGSRSSSGRLSEAMVSQAAAMNASVHSDETGLFTDYTELFTDIDCISTVATEDGLSVDMDYSDSDCEVLNQAMISRAPTLSGYSMDNLDALIDDNPLMSSGDMAAQSTAVVRSKSMRRAQSGRQKGCMAKTMHRSLSQYTAPKAALTMLPLRVDNSDTESTCLPNAQPDADLPSPAFSLPSHPDQTTLSPKLPAEIWRKMRAQGLVTPAYPHPLPSTTSPQPTPNPSPYNPHIPQTPNPTQASVASNAPGSITLDWPKAGMASKPPGGIPLDPAQAGMASNPPGSPSLEAVHASRVGSNSGILPCQVEVTDLSFCDAMGSPLNPSYFQMTSAFEAQSDPQQQVLPLTSFEAKSDTQQHLGQSLTPNFEAKSDTQQQATISLFNVPSADLEPCLTFSTTTTNTIPSIPFSTTSTSTILSTPFSTTTTTTSTIPSTPFATTTSTSFPTTSFPSTSHGGTPGPCTSTSMDTPQPTSAAGEGAAQPPQPTSAAGEGAAQPPQPTSAAGEVATSDAAPITTNSKSGVLAAVAAVASMDLHAGDPSDAYTACYETYEEEGEGRVLTASYSSSDLCDVDTDMEVLHSGLCTSPVVFDNAAHWGDIDTDTVAITTATARIANPVVDENTANHGDVDTTSKEASRGVVQDCSVGVHRHEGSSQINASKEAGKPKPLISDQSAGGEGGEGPGQSLGAGPETSHGVVQSYSVGGGEGSSRIRAGKEAGKAKPLISALEALAMALGVKTLETRTETGQPVAVSAFPAKHRALHPGARVVEASGSGIQSSAESSRQEKGVQVQLTDDTVRRRQRPLKKPSQHAVQSSSLANTVPYRLGSEADAAVQTAVQPHCCTATLLYRLSSEADTDMWAPNSGAESGYSTSLAAGEDSDIELKQMEKLPGCGADTPPTASNQSGGSNSTDEYEPLSSTFTLPSYTNFRAPTTSLVRSSSIAQPSFPKQDEGTHVTLHCHRQASVDPSQAHSTTPSGVFQRSSDNAWDRSTTRQSPGHAPKATQPRPRTSGQAPPSGQAPQATHLVLTPGHTPDFHVRPGTHLGQGTPGHAPLIMGHAPDFHLRPGTHLRQGTPGHAPQVMGHAPDSHLRPGTHLGQGTPGHAPQVMGQGSAAAKTQPGSVLAADTQPRSVSVAYTQPGSVSAAQTQPGTVSTTDTQPRSLSVAYTQPRSLSAAHTQSGSVSTTDTQPSSLPVAYTQPGSVSVAYTQPESVPDVFNQRVSASAAGTQPVSLSPTDTQPVLVSVAGTRPVSLSATDTQLVFVSVAGAQPESIPGADTRPMSLPLYDDDFFPGALLDSKYARGLMESRGTSDSQPLSLSEQLECASGTREVSAEAAVIPPAYEIRLNLGGEDILGLGERPERGNLSYVHETTRGSEGAGVGALPATLSARTSTTSGVMEHLVEQFILGTDDGTTYCAGSYFDISASRKGLVSTSSCAGVAELEAFERLRLIGDTLPNARAAASPCIRNTEQSALNNLQTTKRPPYPPNTMGASGSLFSPPWSSPAPSTSRASHARDNASASGGSRETAGYSHVHVSKRVQQILSSLASLKPMTSPPLSSRMHSPWASHRTSQQHSQIGGGPPMSSFHPSQNYRASPMSPAHASHQDAPDMYSNSLGSRMSPSSSYSPHVFARNHYPSSSAFKPFTSGYSPQPGYPPQPGHPPQPGYPSAWPPMYPDAWSRSPAHSPQSSAPQGLYASPRDPLHSSLNKHPSHVPTSHMRSPTHQQSPTKQASPEPHQHSRTKQASPEHTDPSADFARFESLLKKLAARLGSMPESRLAQGDMGQQHDSKEPDQAAGAAMGLEDVTELRELHQLVKHELGVSPAQRLVLWRRIESLLACQLPPILSSLDVAVGSLLKDGSSSKSYDSEQHAAGSEAGELMLIEAMNLAHRSVAPNATMALAMDLDFKIMRMVTHGGHGV